MDVDWSKTQKGKENYNLKAVQDFEDAGVNHVRTMCFWSGAWATTPTCPSGRKRT